MEWQPRIHSRTVLTRFRVPMGNPNISKTKKAVSHSPQQTRELAPDSRKVEIAQRGRRVSLEAGTGVRYRVHRIRRASQNSRRSRQKSICRQNHQIDRPHRLRQETHPRNTPSKKQDQLQENQNTTQGQRRAPRPAGRGPGTLRLSSRWSTTVQQDQPNPTRPNHTAKREKHSGWRGSGQACGARDPGHTRILGPHHSGL